MNIQYEVSVLLNLELPEKGTKARIKNVDLIIEAGRFNPGLKKPDGGFTDQGVKAVTDGLIQGLVANIHYAHQTGIRQSAEHLRHIIAELERGFSFPAATATTGFYGEQTES